MLDMKDIITEGYYNQATCLLRLIKVSMDYTRDDKAGQESKLVDCGSKCFKDIYINLCW